MIFLFGRPVDDIKTSVRPYVLGDKIEALPPASCDRLRSGEQLNAASVDVRFDLVHNLSAEMIGQFFLASD